ncbi:hypothetical protein D3C71_1633910 [compost metagenome]
MAAHWDNIGVLGGGQEPDQPAVAVGVVQHHGVEIGGAAQGADVGGGGVTGEVVRDLIVGEGGVRRLDRRARATVLVDEDVVAGKRRGRVAAQETDELGVVLLHDDPADQAGIRCAVQLGKQHVGGAPGGAVLNEDGRADRAGLLKRPGLDLGWGRVVRSPGGRSEAQRQGGEQRQQQRPHGRSFSEASCAAAETGRDSKRVAGRA